MFSLFGASFDTTCREGLFALGSYWNNGMMENWNVGLAELDLFIQGRLKLKNDQDTIHS